jgi:hypothetical protein
MHAERPMRCLFIALIALAAVSCGETDTTDECVPEECTIPPASVCVVDAIGVTTDVLVTYLDQGTCVQDRCAYQALQASCPGDCRPEFDEEGEPVRAECVPFPPG